MPGFSVILTDALTDPELDASAKVTYAALSSFAGPRGTHPTHVELAARAGLSISTVQRGLRQLRERGYLSWTRVKRGDGGWDHNEYTLSVTTVMSDFDPSVNLTDPIGQSDRLEVLNNNNLKTTADVVLLPHQELGLKRAHAWYPQRDHIAAAASVERFMSADDYIDRFIVRRGGVAKCSSREWLQWFLDDDARARQAERAEARAGGQLTDDTGTPLNWRT